MLNIIRENKSYFISKSQTKKRYALRLNALLQEKPS
jgi:hypothetical protein